MSEIIARREQAIADYGWAVQGVFSTPEAPGPSFAYTIGLHQRGLPELICIGLPPAIGHQLLNDVAVLCNARLAAGDGFLYGSILHERWPLPFFLLPAESALVADYACAAMDRSDGQASFTQVCWPDKAGALPWQPAYAGVRENQPILGPSPPTVH